MAVSRLRSALVVIVTAVALSDPGVVAAQDRANATRDDAVLIVDGVVREVFQSPRRDRVDLIVQIEVKRSEAVRSPRTASRVPMPAPGDMVYVHATQRQGAALGLAGSDNGQPPPRDAAAAMSLASDPRCVRSYRPGRAVDGKGRAAGGST